MCEIVFLKSQTFQHLEPLYKVNKELKDVLPGHQKVSREKVYLGLLLKDKPPIPRGTGRWEKDLEAEWIKVRVTKPLDAFKELLNQYTVELI